MKKLLVFFVVSFMLFFSATTFAAYVWFDFNGDQVADTDFSLLPGGTFGTDIYLSGIGQTSSDAIYAMGFDFLFDPAQVSVISKNVNISIWAFQPVADDSVPGRISFMAGSKLGGPVTGDNVLLASLGFDCLGAGSSFFETERSSTGGGFYGGPGDLADNMTWGRAQINQVVPIPGAIWLLGSGLLGLVTIRRRRAKV